MNNALQTWATLAEPIILIVGGVWMWAAHTARTADLMNSTRESGKLSAKLLEQINTHETRIAVLETNNANIYKELGTLSERLEKMDAKIDRLLER